VVKRHRRLIAAVVVLAVAIVVGIAYGYLAGIAVALGAITILIFIVGIPMGFNTDLGIDSTRYFRKRMGAEDDDSRRGR
jgi:predicted RND superfamily exporter protein